MAKRRSTLAGLTATLAFGACLIAPPGTSRAEPAVEQWGMAEIVLRGPSGGNPFTEVELSARVTRGDHALEVAGFYDGDGVYRVRFMPDRPGEWHYATRSNRTELDGKTGRIEVTKPSPGNHGPVRVRNTFHFAYADGTPYVPVGTTCYAWTHQGDSLEERTLETLRHAPFNKLRMCVFPKFYAYNRGEPPLYPFAGTPPRTWDFSRFHPAFFRHLERRVGQLRDLGIEADLILLHPYDKGHWGFDRMAPAEDDRYLRYVVARLAPYRNVWWSLANEWDFLKEKREADWDRMFQVVRDADPYGHLRSIHNGTLLYNHTRPWVTHASIQNGSAVEDSGRAVLYRDVYRKPVVFDEVKYEGDIPERWGHLTAEELVHRFWQGAIAGTYVGHGETYRDPGDVLWWSKGGVLRGQSPPRIAFLRKILEDGPREGLEPIDKWQDAPVAGKKGEFYLVYLGRSAPREWAVELPRAGLDDPMTLEADVIDTWDMTITPLEGTFTLRPRDRYTDACPERPGVALPGKPYMAIRLRRVPAEAAP
jgi:Domain of unknown function (DUF5060)/Protein of unknown function (DUF4038)/Domain of unknown function (DUF5605)